MRFRFLTLILLVAVMARPVSPPQEVKAPPLTKDQVLHLVTGGVPNERTAALVEQRGIDFLADEEYLNTLRQAGANDAVLAAVREAGAQAMTELTVVTSPDAEVFLDGKSQGRADAQGELRLKTKLGAHTFKVSLAGKMDFQEDLMLTGPQAAPIEARLVDAPGSIRLRTLAGASITFDGVVRGSADANGEIVLNEVSPGAHELRVSALQKKEYLQRVVVTAGQETSLEAQLLDAPGSIRLRTLAGASITLDGVIRGSADANGEMVLDEVSPGAHELRVSALQKKEYLQRVVVTAGQETSLEAQLVDAPGSIRLRTLAGASITLDGAGRGSTDANGELVLGDLSPGAHQLQVSAPQKKAYLQTVMVTAGQESRVEATLLDALPPLPQVRENPKDGLKYVWIPPGSFEMGCSRGDNVCFADEKPSHHVVLTKGFWLGQTEVTVGAFQRFAEATVRHLPRAPKFDANWANDRFPIVNVNWSGARDYCKWAGGRLPTEAEWEYAARGGSGEVRYGELGDIAWSNENSQGQAHEVAQKRANAFGLYDLLGNVGEWVNDWYEKTYYQNSPSQDPSGPTSGSTRVLRGGSWNGSAWDLRVSGRYGSNPDLANDYVGFRCVGETSSP